MTLSSKESRPARSVVQEPDGDEFDFGDPEIITVEIAPGKYLDLREPSANDLIEISKINSDSNKKSLSEVESTLAVICILHSPGPDGKKLTMRDAKRLRAKQIKTLAEAMNQLMGYEEEEDDSKSDDDEEL